MGDLRLTIDVFTAVLIAFGPLIIFQFLPIVSLVLVNVLFGMRVSKGKGRKRLMQFFPFALITSIIASGSTLLGLHLSYGSFFSSSDGFSQTIFYLCLAFIGFYIGLAIESKL